MRAKTPITRIPESGNFRPALHKCDLRIIDAFGSHLVEWLKRFVENRIHQKEKDQLFRRLQETILRSIKDPNLTKDSKEYLGKQLGELKRLEVSRSCQQIRFLKKEMNE